VGGGWERDGALPATGAAAALRRLCRPALMVAPPTHPLLQPPSPGGTTIAGVHELEKGGVRAAYMSAVVAATNRANELSRM
jgi:hypothetical protein